MEKLMAAVLVLTTIAAAGTTCSAATTYQNPEYVLNWAKHLNPASEKLTKLHFFCHHLHGATATTIAKANSTDTSPTHFGLLDMRDDPLTVGPDDSSQKLGYAQGISAAAALEEITSFDVFTFVFTDKVFNGSTLAVLGSCAITSTPCEVAVVGGSGNFRLARGVVTTTAYYMNFTTGKAVVEIDVVALHY